jgi:hypothetical protein
MWEKLLELALFVRSNGTHRKPTEILKSFIKKPEVPAKLSKRERAALTTAFQFLKQAYKTSALRDSRLATDQTHFYSMATSLLSSDVLTRYSEDVLTGKLVKFANLIEKPHDPHKFPPDPLRQAISKYQSLSSEKTTDAARRKDRQQEFIKAIDLL